MKRSSLLILALVVVAGGYIAHDLMVDTASLALVNESLEEIGDLEVKVWNQEFALGLLAPGDAKKITIRDFGDSNWQISGRWKSGDIIREEVGYITHGMDFTDQIVFAPNRKIMFSSAPR